MEWAWKETNTQFLWVTRCWMFDQFDKVNYLNYRQLNNSSVDNPKIISSYNAVFTQHKKESFIS